MLKFVFWPSVLQWMPRMQVPFALMILVLLFFNVQSDRVATTWFLHWSLIRQSCFGEIVDIELSYPGDGKKMWHTWCHQLNDLYSPQLNVCHDFEQHMSDQNLAGRRLFMERITMMSPGVGSLEWRQADPFANRSSRSSLASSRFWNVLLCPFCSCNLHGESWSRFSLFFIVIWQHFFKRSEHAPAAWWHKKTSYMYFPDKIHAWRSLNGAAKQGYFHVFNTWEPSSNVKSRCNFSVNARSESQASGNWWNASTRGSLFTLKRIFCLNGCKLTKIPRSQKSLSKFLMQ